MNHFQSFLFAIDSMLLFLLVSFASLAAYIHIKDRVSLARKQRKLSRLLAGRDLQATVDATGYFIGHSQGDSVYSISDAHHNHAFVAWAPTVLDAQLWILERSAEPS